MHQQAKLLAPGQHLRTKTGRHPKQANRNRHTLQPVGHGKAAVKNFQRDGAYLAGRCKFNQAAGTRQAVGLRAYRLLNLTADRARCQPQPQIVDTPVTREAFKVLLVHGDGSKLSGVVAPDTGDIKQRRAGIQTQCY